MSTATRERTPVNSATTRPSRKAFTAGMPLTEYGSREARVGVDVDLDERDRVPRVLDRRLDHRREGVARAAPVRPEVDEHGLSRRSRDHLLLEGLFGGVDRHQALSGMTTSAAQPAISAAGTCSRCDTGERAVIDVDLDRRPRPRARARAAPSAAPIASRSSVEMTPRVPFCRRAMPSSSRSSSKGSIRMFESEPMHSGIDRSRTAATRRNPSPRSASVVGQAQMRAAGRGEVIELRVVRVRRMDDRRAAASGSRCRREARSGGSRARRGTPGSRAAARRRGCGAGAPRAPRSAPISSSQSREQARTEWGASADRDPRLAERLDLGEVRRDRRLAHPLEAAALVRDVEEHDLDARLALPPPLPRTPPATPR